MYTLEKHLQKYSSESNDFELLNSIWSLNKKHIPNAQSAISFNFPHYSQHEKSHSDTIIKNIESFLGEDRISKLSPTDTWLILMSCYTHDLGMVVFHKTLEKKWNEHDFQKYLQQLSDKAIDSDLQNSANLLLKFQESIDGPEVHKTSPIEIRNAVLLVTAEFFRRSHHLRSKEIILGNDDEFFKLINGFNLNGIPSRFAEVLSEIAFAHGINFYDALTRLEYIANGFGSDKMHPRFIACLLRLGDLLDVDDSRFNIFNNKVFSNELPITSKLHAAKHAAVKHLLISPQSIEVTVDCKGNDVYRVAREWFDWLQDEVKNQNTEWAQIAPGNLQGLPPTISNGKIKVLYKSVEPQKELMNLRFAISNQKVFEMFEGAAIYHDPGFVFFREIVQNAIDASNIQMWRLLKSGYYDYQLRTHLELHASTSHEEIIKKIVYPTDIPIQFWENFKIELDIDWSDERQNAILISITDRGTGISTNDLIRMTYKVGESRSNDELFQTLKDEMPYWLKPTGAFGIGLQSLFLVTNTFTIQTKTEEEPVKEIEFHSAKKGEYSRITGEKPKMDRGTRVFFEIPIDKFDDIFPNDILDSYDEFSSQFNIRHFDNIKYYLSEHFRYVNTLSIHLFQNSIKKYGFTSQGTWRKLNSRLTDLLILCEDESSTYIVHDSNVIGAKLKLNFNFQFSRQHQYGIIEYYVRNIPTGEEDRYARLRYCDLIVDFMSPESDKILNISRDKLIQKQKKLFDDNLIKDILPRAIEEIIIDFCITYRENCKEEMARKYFNILLTAQLLGINDIEFTSESTVNILSPHTFSKKIICNNNFSELKYSDFFNNNKLILISGNPGIDLVKTFNKLKNLSVGYQEGLLVFLGIDNYFVPYLYSKLFYIVESNQHHVNGKKIDVNVFCRVRTNNDFVAVKRNTEKVILLEYHYSQREYILPYEDYAHELAVKNELSENYISNNHFIISPFKSYSEVIEYRKKINTALGINISTDSEAHMDEIVLKIKEDFIDELIPQKMQNWIIRNSSMQPNINQNDFERRRKNILEQYAKLIAEILRYNKMKEDQEF